MCGGVIGSCLNSILVFSGPTDTAFVESMISSSVFCDLYLQRVRLRNSLHSYHFLLCLTSTHDSRFDVSAYYNFRFETQHIMILV